MPEKDIIKVNNIRIFTPSDFEKYQSVISNDALRRKFIILTYTGLRYAEFQRLYNHPEWYLKSRNAIHLDKFAAKKAERTQLERYVHPLPDLMPEIMLQFFNDPKPPTLQTWDENMTRWAKKAGFEKFEYVKVLNEIDEETGEKKTEIKETYGISAKTTRKTIESWMIIAGVPESVVYLRQGHDRLTSLNHYLGLPFTSAERDEIKRRLAWIPK